MAELTGRRVLVTGGGGFIPSHLVRRLVQLRAEVFVIVKDNSIFDNVRLVDVWELIQPVEADIRNLDSLQQLRAIKPEVIYHLAAYNHVGDSFLHVNEALDCNAKGTANVLETCEDYERFVYISTSEVYGKQDSVPFVESMCPNPISPYAVGKYAGELYSRMQMQMKNRRIVVLRPFNAFGPYQSPRAIIAELMINCLAGRPIRTTKGIQTRDFNFVGNLVDGFILAGVRDEAIGNIINVGSGRETSIRELVENVHRVCGSSSELHIGALPYRPTEIWRMIADRTRAFDLIGWVPKISLETGLEITASWYRNFQTEFESPASALCRLSAGQT